MIKHKPYIGYIVRKALADGRLIRMPCEVCGTTESIHGHHNDYDKPLEVKWLCRTHHILLHKKLGTYANRKPNREREKIIMIFGITYYRIVVIAKMMNVTPYTVREWCKNNKIKSLKKGRDIYIAEDEIREFLEPERKGE